MRWPLHFVRAIFGDSLVLISWLVWGMEWVPLSLSTSGRITSLALTVTLHGKLQVFFCGKKELHSALKLKKSAISKVQKAHYLPFQIWQKINFCIRKKFKTTKNAIFGLFSGAKMDFLPFFENAKNVFLHFWYCTFFPILEHCELAWHMYVLCSMYYK